MNAVGRGQAPGRSIRAVPVALVAAWVALVLSAALPVSAPAMEIHVAIPGRPLPAPGSAADTTSGAGGEPVALQASPADTLIATFRVDGLLGPDDTAGDGVPATLLLVVDLWRERSGWWDSLVRSQVITYRFRRDIWSGRCQLWIQGAADPVTLADRDALLAYLGGVHEVVLGLPGSFEPGKNYYLTVKGVLQPMDLDDLQQVDAWLNGNVTGSKGVGGILGVPKALARMVVDVSGLGDQSVVGRSRAFLVR